MCVKEVGGRAMEGTLGEGTRNHPGSPVLILGFHSDCGGTVLGRCQYDQDQNLVCRTPISQES